MILTMARL